ncbi:MAG: polysaccharide deacetylase family protein [Acidobacteria bacterium]|nr:polysaccharide deacetylase family protein [Acidobacteriota bacterium]
MSTLIGSARRKRDLFGVSFGLIVLMVLGLQVVLYLMVMQDTVGPFMPFRKVAAPHPAMARELKVALLRSEATARMSQTRPEYYYDLEQHWESVLREAHIPYRVISDRQLSTVGNDFPVLVLPWAACLGEAELKAISGAVARGAGLVASGALGSRDAECSWKGWDYLTQITGVRAPYTVQASGAFNAVFRGGGFYSQGIPAGYNVELPRQEFVAGNTELPDVFWSDWKLRPAQGTNPGNTTLAVHTTRGQGRVVWFGFAETPPNGQAADRVALRHYMESCVRWAGRQAIGVVDDWPGRHRAAVLIAEEVQHMESAMAAASFLQQERIPAVFFCNSEVARSSPAILRKLEAVGEVGSAGDSAEPFGDQQTAMQTDRLLRAKHDLEGSAPVRVLGFNPPQGSSNADTAVSVTNAGYHYYLDASEVRRAVPEMFESGGSALLPIPRSEIARIYRASSDDFEIIANYRGPTPWGNDLAEGFLDEFQRVLYLGGLYPLVFRSDLLGSPQNLHILRKIVERLKTEPVWIASGESLVRWWSEREKLRVDVRKISSHRLRVAITNRGQYDLEDASAHLYLPYTPRHMRISSTVLRLQLPHSELTSDGVLRLDFPVLRRQSSYVLLIALDE